MPAIILDPRIIAVSLVYAFRNGLEDLHGNKECRFGDEVIPFMSRRLAHYCYRCMRDDAPAPSRLALNDLLPFPSAHARAAHWWQVGLVDTGITKHIVFTPQQQESALACAAREIRSTAEFWVNFLDHPATASRVAAEAGSREPHNPTLTHPLDILADSNGFYDRVPGNWDDPSLPTPTHFTPGCVTFGPELEWSRTGARSIGL